MQDISGIGLEKAITIKAVIELSFRYIQKQKNIKPKGLTTNDFIQIAKMELKHEVKEFFSVILLNKHNQFIAFERIVQGSHEAVRIEPRLLMEKCLLHESQKIVLVHNHPINTTKPNQTKSTRHYNHVLPAKNCSTVSNSTH